MSEPEQESGFFQRVKKALEECIAFTRGEMELRTTELSDSPPASESMPVCGTDPATRSMILRRGITGFRHVDDEPLPETDRQAFHRHCHEVARRVKGRVVAGVSPLKEVEHNFAYRVIATPSGQVAVLLNAHYPIIAFAAPLLAGDMVHRFMDCSALAEAFRSVEVYEVMGSADLEAPADPHALRELLPVELEQVEYWRPRRVGDLIFNFWD